MLFSSRSSMEIPTALNGSVPLQQPLPVAFTLHVALQRYLDRKSLCLSDRRDSTELAQPIGSQPPGWWGRVGNRKDLIAV